ncbi:type VII secretion target [Kitasatospora xanthocidica]|uniref:type VII secretion target n=1 Tax=Kitasatospora xanthocidica TaxID=83382 RepID=UPI0036E7F84B
MSGKSSDALKVDTNGLKKVGKQCHDIAEQMPAELALVHKPSDEAAAGLSGWLSGAAITACTEAWEKGQRQLAKDIDDNGNKMITAADNYDGVDEAVHKSLVYGGK